MSPTSFDSPVCLLLPFVFDSMAKIAPERAAEISKGLLPAFRLTDKPGLAFSAATEATPPVISIPLRGLEYLWALSYSTWVIHDHYSQPGRTSVDLDFKAHDDTRPISKFLVWALKNQMSGDYALWPRGTPIPGPLTEDRQARPLIEAITNEMTLCAVSWILHHERSHIEEGHSATVPLVQDEAEADRAATVWLMDDAAPGIVAAKRGFGIAIATIGIAMYELLSARAGGSSNDTHPNPAARIFSALSHERVAAEPVVAQVAAVMLKLLLHLGSVDVGSEVYEGPQEALNHYCMFLQRAIEAARRQHR